MTQVYTWRLGHGTSGQWLAESHTYLVIRFQVRIPSPTSSLEHLGTAPTWTTQMDRETTADRLSPLAVFTS